MQLTTIVRKNEMPVWRLELSNQEMAVLIANLSDLFFEGDFDAAVSFGQIMQEDLNSPLVQLTLLSIRARVNDCKEDRVAFFEAIMRERARLGKVYAEMEKE